MPALLEIATLRAGYGDVRVLHGVDIAVPAHRVTAVVGANGAGKTTLMRVLAGLVSAEAGTQVLDGEDVAALPPHDRVARGIVMVPEGRLIFPGMTVRENLMAGAQGAEARARRSETLERVHAIFPRLRERERQAGGTLSGGEQQMLALGRGLMARPRVLLLDEPTLGLAPAIAKQIFLVLADLAAEGLTILIAEQDVARTLKIAERAYVLENGHVVHHGNAAQLLNDDAVRKAYLGG